MLDKLNIWDESIAHVRIFQTAVAKCIKETIPKTSFNQFMNLIIKDCNVISIFYYLSHTAAKMNFIYI